VLLAHKLALASDFIRSDMVECMEFPHLVNRYMVSAVPLIVINEVLRIEGAHPEEAFVRQLMTVRDASAMEQRRWIWENRFPKTPGPE
jgi:predicted DsbA family dithiol-disulfide isomerase